MKHERFVCRGVLLAFVVALLLGLAGCQTTPPAPIDNKVVTLQKAGFIRTEEGWQLNLALNALLFDYASDQLTAEDKSAIASLSHSLLEVGIDRLRIEGHADKVGSTEFNRALSRRRADTVAREFVRNGIPPDNIVRQGFGFDKPIADNATTEGRAKNRRVVIIVPSF